MGIRVIGQKKFEVTETELLQQDLLFYLDNPRVYSVLHENGHDNPTQTEIEEIMCSLDHVKSLKSQIMQNGGASVINWKVHTRVPYKRIVCISVRLI